MGMVTEMHLSGAPDEVRERFNYKGMHRYLITFFAARKKVTLAEKETVTAVLAILRPTCREHQFDTFAYSFLPDRLVLIVRGKSVEADFKKFIATFRAASTAALEPRRGRPVWARKYQERVLRKTEITRTIADEVFRLAVKGGFAARPSAYEFQGSFVLESIEHERPAMRSSVHARPVRKRPGGHPGRTRSR